MPASILRFQATESNLLSQVTSINRQIAELAREMDDIDKMTKDNEEMYRWVHEDGPTPKWVIEHKRREQEEFLKNCVVLKLPKYVSVSGPAGGPIVA